VEETAWTGHRFQLSSYRLEFSQESCFHTPPPVLHRSSSDCPAQAATPRAAISRATPTVSMWLIDRACFSAGKSFGPRICVNELSSPGRPRFTVDTPIHVSLPTKSYSKILGAFYMEGESHLALCRAAVEIAIISGGADVDVTAENNSTVQTFRACRAFAASGAARTLRPKVPRNVRRSIIGSPLGRQPGVGGQRGKAGESVHGRAHPNRGPAGAAIRHAGSKTPSKNASATRCF
jgi:hypothetical protein